MISPKAKIWLGHIRDLIIVMVIGNVISFLFDPRMENIWERIQYGSLYSLFIGGILWKGNQYIGFILSKKMDIHNHPSRNLAYNLSLMFIFSLLTIIAVNYIWYVVIFGWTPERLFSRGWITMVIVFFVTVLITSIFYSIGFFKAWKESAVNEEKLQKESIRLQYQALKNQVNPHFLFNSLNSLSSLVYKDQDQAVRFIKQLSEVYRYVLEHKDSELVTLSDEINFCEKYIYLQKIRHDDSLNVRIEVKSMQGKYVVPVSIQILIENAIKHNIVSDEDPLHIEIFDADDTIVIQNKLQPRKSLDASGGIGLSSLKDRYSFLTDREITVKKTEDQFIVALPLIHKSNK